MAMKKFSITLSMFALLLFVSNADVLPSIFALRGVDNRNSERFREGSNAQQHTNGNNSPSGGNNSLNDSEQLSASATWFDNLPDAFLVFVLFGALWIISLIFHSIHFIKAKNNGQWLQGLSRQFQRMQSDNTPRTTANHEIPKNLALSNQQIEQQLYEHYQNIDRLSTAFDSVLRRLDTAEVSITKAVSALVFTTQSAGKERIQEAQRRAAADLSDSDRAAFVRKIEHYNILFSANADRMQPLLQQFSTLNERARQQFDLPSELLEQIQNLQDELEQLEVWRRETTDRIEALRRGSFDERLALFKQREQQLRANLDEGKISIAEYTVGYNRMAQECFPMHDVFDVATLAEYENDLKKITDRMPDYLMDWFDNLFQVWLKATGVNSGVAVTLNQIKQQAREALGTFDIQPEELQIGQTLFDRRLHEPALIAQSVQYPANTVIGVEQCGFRRITTGEALRRPRVIVAGSGAGW
jgi:hypothetical protein